MKTLITAAILSVASNVALADNFAPWDNRDAVVDAAASSSAVFAPSGFAPWRDTIKLPAVRDQGVRFSATDISVFRPWS